jgi:hypothetical protein
MGRYGLVIPLVLALGVIALTDCAPQATVTSSQAQIPALAPGTARVWFFRGWDSLSGQGFVYGAAPTIYANGAPVGDIPTGTDFFRDFPPGTYNFTVEPIGLPTTQAATVQLAAGTQSYLQVQWGSQLAVRLSRGGFQFRTQYLRCPDDVATGGTGISTHPDVSRSALIQTKLIFTTEIAAGAIMTPQRAGAV